MSSSSALNLRVLIVAAAVIAVGVVVYFTVFCECSAEESTPCSASVESEASATMPAEPSVEAAAVDEAPAPIAAAAHERQSIDEWRSAIAQLGEGLPPLEFVIPLSDGPESIETSANARAILANLMALGPDAVGATRAAARSVVDECPYNRATVQLVVTMAREFDIRPHAQGSSPELADARNRLVSVRNGFAAHFDIIDALWIADLPPLSEDGFLGSSAIDVGVASLAELDASGDRLAAAVDGLGRVNEIVTTMDDETFARINASTEVLTANLGEMWPHKNWLALQNNDLRTVRDTAQRVLDACDRDGCADNLRAEASGLRDIATRFHDAIAAQLVIRC